jgi:hypothetical protein
MAFGSKNELGRGPSRDLAFGVALVLFVAFFTSSARAEAQGVDVHDSRLTLSASYGFLATFYSDDEASGANPNWGHGISLRLGGERCGRLCYGLSLLGSINVSPEASGSVGVGPHIGFRWGGPSWAGAYNFRLGAAYFWTHNPEPSFPNGEIQLGDGRGLHGVGAWLALGIELVRQPRLFTPIIGISGRYVASFSEDPVEHALAAQVYVGFALGRRLVFGEGEELDPQDPDAASDGGEVSADEDEDDASRFELDEEDERRLREAEEELRN